ncbi:DUF4227 family protein [Desmospora activa]|uniref:Uncharacterized protein DUF4227 n=1 Tax=Desmospora activa DSM 45169 TaxID=1121389 RepID=A0A2T4Z9M7_9BACL|nr:DUF4227 family protein [Desmospora activa]PTM58596.1 uncharacterized protein DUF4227 [Desmospora activa DSM 45169]
MFSLRRVADWIQWLTMFIIWTMILYHVIAILSSWMEPDHRYGEPKGRAVKVFAPSAGQTGYETLWMEIGDRLRLFYRMGE